MTSNVELLPLPKWCYADKHLHVGSVAIRKEMRAYARTNMEPLKAEIERLRAEREVIGTEAVKYADKSGRLEAKVERLAEAFRWYVENDDTNEGQEGNEYWLAGRDRAIAVLRDHDQEGDQ